MLVPIVVVPTSASADGSGTVAATVTPASPCITIDGTTADFGTPVYNTSPSGPDTWTLGTTNSTSPVNQTNIHNCSAAAENIYAHGSNASGTAVTSWTLSDSARSVCTLGTNTYKYRLLQAGQSGTQWYLTTADKGIWGNLAAGNNAGWSNFLVMPCSGSSGAGVAMSMTVTYTATF